jgi:hypothetical protein
MRIPRKKYQKVSTGKRSKKNNRRKMKKRIGGIHRQDQNTLTSHIKLAGCKLMF